MHTRQLSPCRILGRCDVVQHVGNLTHCEYAFELRVSKPGVGNSTITFPFISERIVTGITSIVSRIPTSPD